MVSAALGAWSFFFSCLCVLAVVCFHFPDVLTTPELRAHYPLPFLRSLLAFFIFVSFVMGLLSFLLRPQRSFGLYGLLLSVVAVLLGGAQVPTPESVSSTYYLGLDWFVLDILLVALIFIPLERLFARRPQAVLRPHWQTDLQHFFFSHVLIQVTSFLILFPSVTLGTHLGLPGLKEIVQEQPLLLQFLVIVLIADLAQYWIHRMFHQIPWLWKFHSIHHSSKQMDWLAGSRLHLVDIVITRGLTLVPLFFLGFSEAALHAYLVFVAFWATFVHMNLRWSIDWLTPYFTTPAYHHWHHAQAAEAVDKNFAIHLPWLDRVFGTHLPPQGKWPDQYGLHLEKMPEGYWRQLVHPFRKENLQISSFE